MPSISHLQCLRAATTLVALLTAVAATVACAHSSQSVAPSALAANPSTYDGESVTVSGTVKNPTTRQTRRGTATAYQLCDSACINVIEFGNANVSDGSQVTVSGRFRASFGREQTMTNVLLVGGHRGGYGGEPAPSPSP
jgi:outer membrane lipoprotein-sorting protein